MPKPRRDILATAVETESPPSVLPPAQSICRVKGAAGKNLYHVEQPDSTALLVELAQRFRSTFWIKRGSYVVIDTSTLADRENKINGEIINVVRNEKQWMKSTWWPAEFKSSRRVYEDSDDDETVKVGQMPPLDSEDEG